VTTVIATRGLTKHFGRVHAVDGIDLDVRAGDVYGFLGANGSGKTTTVRMLLGLVLATSGEVDVLGERMPRAGRQVLPRVGALIEGPAGYGHLSGRENLALLDASGPGGRGSTRRHRIDDVLGQVGLSGVGRRPVRAYSLGMRQRLGLAAALLGDPELHVLDEPANGLDPEGVRWLRDFLRSFAQSGHTVLVSSHVLAEVAQTVDHVLIINRGQLVRESRLDELTATVGASVRVRSPQAAQLAEALGKDGITVATSDHTLHVAGATTERVGEIAAAAGVVLHELVAEQSSLEEIFLELTADEAT
jgi:ABC-2 type transport system ATP-binding protein